MSYIKRCLLWSGYRQEAMQREKPQEIALASVTVLRETVMDFMCDTMRRVYHNASHFDETVVEVIDAATSDADERRSVMS